MLRAAVFVSLLVWLSCVTLIDAQAIRISFDSATTPLRNLGSWGAAFDATVDNAIGAVYTTSGFRQSAYAGGSPIRVRGVRTRLLENNEFGTARSLTLSWWMRNWTFTQNCAVFDNSVGNDAGGWLVGTENTFGNYIFCTKFGKFVSTGARPDGVDCYRNWRPWPMRGFYDNDEWFHTAIDFDHVASSSRLIINGVVVWTSDVPVGSSPLLLMLDELVWDGTNKRAFALDELRLDERVFTTTELCSTVIGGSSSSGTCQLPSQPPRPWPVDPPLPTRPPTGATPFPTPFQQPFPTPQPPFPTPQPPFATPQPPFATPRPPTFPTPSPPFQPSPAISTQRTTPNNGATTPTGLSPTTTSTTTATTTNKGSEQGIIGDASSDDSKELVVILAAVLGSVGGLLLIGCIAAAFVIVIKRRNAKEKKAAEIRSAPKSPSGRPMVRRHSSRRRRTTSGRSVSRRGSTRRVSSRRRVSNRPIVAPAPQRGVAAPAVPPE